MDTNYKIITKPSLTYVIKDKKMSFYLQKINPAAPDVGDLIVSWICINNSQSDKGKQSTFYGPNKPEWIGATWNLYGVHTIICTVKHGRSGTPERYEYVQRVISEKECLSYDKGSFEESGNPFNVLHNLKIQIEFIRELESKSKLSDDENAKYQERITNMETYRDKLDYLLKKIPDSHKDNFNAVPTRHYSSAYPETNSISLQICYFYADNKVYLLDWTTPTTQGWCGVFEGKGKTEREAILDAFDEWEDDNRYPTGRMECHYLYATQPTLTIPQVTTNDGKAMFNFNVTDYYYWQTHEFKTSGETFWDKISNTLSWIALGAAVVAGGILLFVPGGQAGTAVAWGFVISSVASMAASGINITQRYNSGFSNGKEDGLDGLTIAASLLGLGSLRMLTKWGPLAIMSKEGANLAKINTIKVMLIGQVAADSTQGIMISIDVASAIYSTIDDTGIPADEKLSRVLRLLSAGVTTGALTYLNIKGTSANFNLLKQDNTMLRVMSREEVDAMLNNPNLIIIDHVETPKPVTISDRDLQQTVAVKQLYELKLLNAGNSQPNSPYVNNVLIPNKQYLQQQLNTNYRAGRWLEEELNRMFMVNRPYDAVQSRLLIPYDPNTIVPWSPVARASNQRMTRDIVNTEVKREINHTNIAKLQQIARELQLEDPIWKKAVAFSRATCSIEGITFDSAKNFSNLPFGFNDAVEKGLVIKMGEFTTNSAPIKVVDIDRYLDTLKKYYPGGDMDELTSLLIKNYLIKHDGILSNFHGMPGAHAEVVAVDDVFKQLRAMDLNPADYLSEIEVYTLKTNRPNKPDFLSEFPACTNCSGILVPEIQVHTGRKE